MTASSQPFGSTWWGRAWLEALESSGTGYESQLPRGRSYARKGHVREFELNPGHISAKVVDRSGELYRVDIAVRTLAPVEQDQIAAAIAARAAHLAALLDGELLPAVVEDAAEVDVALLPAASDLRPDCSCEDWAEPCKHAAAVCYVIAAELDRDPFMVFLLRGVTRSDLLDAVRRQRGSSAAGTDSDHVATPGSDEAPEDDPDYADAATLWLAAAGDDPSAPEGLRGRPAALGAGPLARYSWQSDLPRRAGVDPTAIEELAVDAAQRAWVMLADEESSMLQLGQRGDLARRAASAPEELTHLAALAGVSATSLRSWAQAWLLGGEPAVELLADQRSWCTEQSVLSDGREQLEALGIARRSIALNFDSLGMSGNMWLVSGPDQRWYRLTGSDRHGELRLAAPPSYDITDLVEAPGDD